MKSRNSKIFTKQRNYFLITFLIVSCSLCLATWSLIFIILENHYLLAQNLTTIVIAIFLQAIVVVLSCEAWLSSLPVSRKQQYSVEFIVISGLYNACKYVPGKIWGLVVRSTLLQNYTSGTIRANDTLSDQVAMVHSGGSLLIAILAFEKANWLGGLTLAFIALSIYALNPIIIIAKQSLAHSSYKPFIKLSQIVPEVCSNYFLVYLKYIAVWLILTLSLGLCLITAIPSLGDAPLQILRITLIGYFAGFIAFMLPAGIGARDGAIFISLGYYASHEAALFGVLLHRAVVTIADIALAIPALPFLHRFMREPA